jgi:hypothetical protein
MKTIYIFICLGLAIIPMGFMSGSQSPQKEIKKSIALGNAKELKTEISFTAGELNINSSTDHLADGTYRFYIDKWKPDITYREETQTGYLKIRTIDERKSRNYDNEDNCEWNISLNKKVLNDLTVKMIAGKGHIDLHDCNLKRFDFTMAAGEIDINLRNTSVPDLKFEAAVGSGVIDLSGKWNNDLNASMKGGVGELTLKLPSHTGIKLNIHGGLGETNAPGLKKQNGTYTNALFGKTKESLYIDFSGGIGNVNVQLVD